MSEFQIGDHIRFNDFVPNPRWIGITGVIVGKTTSDDEWDFDYKVRADPGQSAPLEVTDVFDGDSYMDLLRPPPPPSEAQIKKARRGLDRLLRDD